MPGHPQDSHYSSARKNRRRRIGLTPFREERLKRQLRRKSPSEPWVEAQIKGAEDVAEDGTTIIYRYHDPHAFPPGGAETAMRRCRQCGIFMPPDVLQEGICIDHGGHTGWGPSPSAVAIRALQMFNLRMEQSELPSEDFNDLRNEIVAFKRFERQKRKNATRAQLQQ